MNRLCSVLMIIWLAACASSTPPEPTQRKQAEAAAISAARASNAGNWRAAALLWPEAAQRYQALDDWAAVGTAKLAWAQALAYQAKPAEARALLDEIIVNDLYSPATRAEAHYQYALSHADNHDWAAALAEADKAEATTNKGSPLQAALANLRSRAALAAQAWQAGKQYAQAAQAITAIEPVERANALRLQGIAATQLQDWPLASSALAAALALDKQLARPVAIAADLQALAKLAELRNTPDATAMRDRASKVCMAAGLKDCLP